MSSYETPRGATPNTVPLDVKAQERELEAAGWKRLERQGKIVWQHPQTGYLYPQGPAVRRLWMDSVGELGGEPVEKPEGEA